MEQQVIPRGGRALRDRQEGRSSRLARIGHRRARLDELVPQYPHGFVGRRGHRHPPFGNPRSR